jgi:ribosome maturation factor RimP
MAADLRNTLIALVEPLLADLGYELTDVQLAAARNHAELRVFIDRAPSGGTAGNEVPLGPDGSGVNIEDCERVSREISALLDVHDPIPTAYTLEVSTPGLDRVLRTEAHFVRFVGRRVNVELRLPRDGRRRFTGAVLRCAGGAVALDVDGEEVTIGLVDIERARLVPEWPDAARGPGHKPGGKRKR